MGSRINSDVLIVGRGPVVGSTLTIDLALRHIDVTVAEARPGGEPKGVRCNHIAARTMEILRRLGLVRAVREAGLPPDYPQARRFQFTFSSLMIQSGKAHSNFLLINAGRIGVTCS